MPKLSLGRPHQPTEPVFAEWVVDEIVDVHDGDTITLLRHSEHILSDWLVSIVKDRRPVKIRLARLDTPELWTAKDAAERLAGQQARDQLAAWIMANMKHGFGLTVLGDGGFSRILGDLHTLASPPVSASDYMRSQGWPDYVRGQ